MSALWLLAVQTKKERMKVEISSMLKSFEELTYQIALGMAEAQQH